MSQKKARHPTIILVNDNMNWKLNIERRTILILTLFVIMIAVILFVLILPTINYIKTLNTQTYDLRQYLEKKYESNHSLLNSKQKIEEIKVASADYENYIFFKGDELKLITQLESLSSLYQITQKIDSTDLDKPLNNSIHISLVLNGNYQNLLQYLTALEKQNYFVNIENLQFSPGFSLANNNTEASVLNLDLVLYATKH